MRQIFIIMLACLCVHTHAQTIIKDVQNETFRTIVCRDEYFATQKGMMPIQRELGLARIEYNNGVDSASCYVLRMYQTNDAPTIEINKGSRMLLKSDNDTITELYLRHDIRSYDWGTYRAGYAIFYRTWLEYTITDQQLQYLINHPIVKIRMEVPFGKGYIEYAKEDYAKQWNPSQILRGMYLCIQQRLKTQNTIYDGF